MSTYFKEPDLTIAVLDFQKPEVTYQCLNSIKKYVTFPVKVNYLHNGAANYPARFLAEGLIDTLIMPRSNGGLGLGTRDLMKSVSSEYTLYLQNDQFFGRHFTEADFEYFRTPLDFMDRNGFIVKSVSLAGQICGENIYSERAHLIRTRFYQEMEEKIPLGHGGAGPYHDSPWREGQIQSYYDYNGYLHLTNLPAFVVDNGHNAIRENPDGSLWEHKPDTKALKLLRGPVKEKYVYPYFTDSEWEQVLQTGFWPEWQIPENEKKNSFRVWN